MNKVYKPLTFDETTRVSSKFKLACVLVLLLGFLTGCGKSPSDQSNFQESSLTGELELDTENLNGKFGDVNPVGFLKSSVGSCTAFVVEGGFILTNSHCLTKGDRTIYPTGEVFLKNPSDSKTERYKIDRVVKNRYTFIADPNDPKLLDRSKPFPLVEEFERRHDSSDWALVEPIDRSIISSKYGKIDLVTDVPSLTELRSDLAVDIIKVNFSQGNVKPKIAIASGKILTSTYFQSSFYQNTLATIGIVNPTDAQIDSHVMNHFKFTQGIVAENLGVIPGNSGSPILYHNRLIGIAYGGYIIYKDKSLLQWIPGTVDLHK